MIFNFAKRYKTEDDSTVTETVQDAILLGHVAELDEAIKLVKGSGTFSEGLRYGLEALRYFRAYYGKDGELEPKDKLQKQKTVLMEQAWSAELLDQLKNGETKLFGKG